MMFKFYLCCILFLKVWLCNGVFSDDGSRLLKEKPNWLRTCKKNDSGLDHCLKELFEDLFPVLAPGVPDLDIDPFEPLHIERVGISKGTGAVTLTGNLYNISTSGPSRAKPTYTHIDFDKGIFKFSLDLPFLDIKSQYNLKGKILVLPLVGHGSSEIYLQDVMTNVTTYFSFVKREGREVFHAERMKVRFVVGGIKVKFDNLFNGNLVLGTTLNNFLNRNGLEVIRELSDNIGENLAGIFTEILNKIFRYLPTDLWLENMIATDR